MENLPRDVLPMILDKCSVTDVLNLACCSSQHNCLMKPLLWRSIKLPVRTIMGEEIPSKILDNLKYVMHIEISTVDDWEEDDILGEDDNPDAISTLSHLLLRRTLTNVLNHCNPLKVSSLATNMPNSYFDTFCHVKKLHLSCTEVDCKRISQLSDLSQLQLFNCDVTDKDIRDIIAGNKLRRLQILSCRQLSNEALIYIGTLRRLTHLTFKSPYEKKNTLVEVTPLGYLSNLAHLTLNFVTMTDHAVKHLCGMLKSLKSLDLTRSYFSSNDALSQISSLACLFHLNLYRCVGLSSECFNHLKGCQALGCLVFSPDICTSRTGRGFEMDENVCNLNKICTLKEVRVHSVTNTAGGVLRSLCRDVDWTIKFKQIDLVTDTYTFLR